MSQLNGLEVVAGPGEGGPDLAELDDDRGAGPNSVHFGLLYIIDFG